MRFLKQSTSVDVGIGPFLDETDGKTAETALTITQPDIRLKKNGGAWAQKAAAQTLTHEENGWYELTLDATDTDTVGQLLVAIHEAGALPVWEYFQVVEEVIYDALFAASANAFTGAAGATQLTALTDGILTAAKIGADAITAAKIATDAIDADAVAADAVTEIQSGLATAAALATVDDFLDTEIAAILAAVDTEVAAILALLDDPRGEPGQGNPPVNPDMATKIDYLYKSWRNKKDNDGSTTKLYADDGATVDQKQATTEAAGVVTKAEWVTGP